MKKLFLLIFVFLCLGIGTGKAQIITDLHFFNGAGEEPSGSLVFTGNKLYGMTPKGGRYAAGVIFSVDSNGNSYTVMHNFNDTAGSQPSGSLTLVGTKLYGMTTTGGADDYGVIFCIDTTGADYKVLLSLTGASDGWQPGGSLTYSKGKLYGMSYYGGANIKGDVFAIDTNGANCKVLFSFNGTNGENPVGDLTLSGNKLYGMTGAGGTFGYGVIFSIDTNGAGFADLLSFNRKNGNDPEGNLTLSGNKLFGVTSIGGAIGAGNIFSIDTNGANFVNMFSFNGSDGYEPYGSLTLFGNKLFGMVAAGPNYGGIFSIDTNGSNFINQAAFNRANGANPFRNSLLVLGNKLYGMTTAGGTSPNYFGVVFGFIPCTLDISTKVIATITCHGGNTGSASVTTSGGKSPYTYSWAPRGGNSAIASNLSAGTYTVTVYDNTGTFTVDSVTITQPNVLNVSANITSSILCNGESNGIMSATVSGGASPYTYLWSNSDTSSNITGLSAGTYTLQVTDNHGCTDSATATITQPTMLNLSVQITANELCNGENIGSASSTVSGGISPYTYLWNNGETTSAASNLYTGLYQLIVTDNNRCITSASITITQPPAIAIIPHSTPDTGNGDGSGWVSVGGGTLPYTYVWTPNRNATDSIFGQPAGKYCCKVTDAHGCIDSACITIISTAGVDKIIPNLGQITVYPNPGNGVFTFQANSQQFAKANYIEVYNVLGEKVYSQFNIQNPTFNINLSPQPNGIYFYRVTTENGDLAGEGKIVIEK